MADIDSNSKEVVRSRLINILDRPLSQASCFVGWILASSLFGILVRIAGGITTSDSFVSVNSSLAVAHGYFSCAYPPQNTLGINPLAPPLYPFLSGGLSALFRIGNSVPFPRASQLGPHCSHAFAAIGTWIVPTGANFSVERFGYVGWVVLAFGVVAILRATGRGRRVWEPVCLAAVACAPPVIMCFNEYFHPQDLIAVGLSLAALASVVRVRWISAGILFGLAFTSQQFALLFLVPLIFIVPRGAVQRLVVSFLATVAILDVPLFIATSGRSLKASLFGTGVNSKSATLLVQLHISGNLLYALSRGLPLFFCVAIAVWTRRRCGASALDPVAMLSLVAVALLLRLAFEINLWGYYFMAVSVVLIVIQIIRGQVNWWFVLWLAVVTYAAIDGGLANRPALEPLPVSFWQVVLVLWAVALALGPLRKLAVNRRDSVTATT
jgi:hypothetical protein